MTKRIESGKSKLIKGSLIFLWEELKTMNRVKFRAILKIISGYFRMKMTSQKKLQ